jgi:hypothetical protein
LVEFPNPFEHQGDVHEFGVQDPQTTERFGLTNSSPVYHMVLPTVTDSFPEEASTVFVHRLVSAIM